MAQQKPEVLQVADDFSRDLRKLESAAMREMAGTYAQVNKALSGQLAALATDVEKLREAGEAVPPWKVVQLQRYRDLLEQAQRELAQLAEQSAEIIAELQQQGISLGLDMAEAQFMALLPEGVNLTFNRLPTGALEMLTGFLADGSPLSRLLAELGDETARRIGELLAEGLGLGWNPRKVADLIRRETGMALARALKIARTELLRAWRESSIRGYRDQGNVLVGYRRMASLDDRTCIACLLMDGHMYALEEDFTDHVQGRCAVVPVTRSWSELGYEGIPDTNAEWQPGEEWFLEQDALTQAKILGNAMYEAWKNGEIGLEDMLTLHESAEWGDSWQAASLKAAMESAARRR